MKRYRLRNLSYLGVAVLLVILVFGGLAAAQAKVEGFITARSGPTMTVQTIDSSKVNVLLTDETKVGQVQGVFKARRKQMSMAALVPGLTVKIEGVYNEQKQLVATSISFKGDDLKNAQAAQAALEKTKADLAEQQAALKQQQETLAAEQQRIAANKAAIEAANRRFGQLDDYNILDEVTVLFGNGKVKVEAQYKPKLLALAEKAKTVNAYIIQVKGYASASGSAELNQRLSEERAKNVVNLLLQDGHVPLTNMLAPGAMGESRQVGQDNSAETEAQNRRVVVRILQNKGVAGVDVASTPR